MLAKIKRYLIKAAKIKRYNNIVEASQVSKLARKISGISVFVCNSTPENRIELSFSKLGFFCFIMWYTAYFYSTFVAHMEDQTVLRSIYKTRLKRYGDDFERIASIIYVLYALWKIPFSLNRNTTLVQKVVDIDKAIENLGEIINYDRYGYLLLGISFGQMLVFIARMACIWLSLANLNVAVPNEKVFQVVFSDTLALVITAHFCYYLILLTDRCKWVSKVLNDISTRKSWEYRVFVRNRVLVDMHKVVPLQDKFVCEKIKACARIYGQVFKATEMANNMFGLALVLTFFLYLVYIVLYLFYFMEATASGLFHGVQKYVDFLIYVFWQIAYALGIIVLNVYFCETVVKEVNKISFVTHEIINNDLSPMVSTEAMQLSVQLLHQTPLFSPCGLFELNYALLQQGARTVSTYLIILLQFVTEKH